MSRDWYSLIFDGTQLLRECASTESDSGRAASTFDFTGLEQRGAVSMTGRKAALIRMAVSTLVGLPSGFTALVWLGGGSPLGLLAAIFPVYIGYVWWSDLATAARGTDFRPRRLYLPALLGAVFVVAFWAGLLSFERASSETASVLSGQRAGQWAEAVFLGERRSSV